MLNPGAAARVLIVDDERQNRKLLEVMLASEGYITQTAVSGEEALEIVAQEAPDLMLLDVMMPGMDGYQVAAAIKATSTTRNIPIIMVTALGDHDSRMRGLNAGAEDFLSKPVDRAELCVRVRNLLRLKAYGDFHDSHSQMLEREVASRTSDLRHERDRARGYLDAAEVILLALDVEGRITLVNRYGCSVLGWTADELIGRDWIETCLSSDLRGAFREKGHDIARDDVSTFESRILARSGQERLVEWRNTLLRDDEGRVIGTLRSGTDITERHRVVEALRIAEERVRFALKNANVGIWDMDYTGGRVQVSEILESQHGLEPGTFGGTVDAFIQRVHPDDRTSVLETIENAARSGSDFCMESRCIRPDGQVRWLSGTGRFVDGGRGQPVRGVGISQDVTERRTLEEQFRQAQKMEAIGKLTAGVAHDFNNLLSVILGFAELMTTDVVATHQQGTELDEIINAANRAAALTNQLLAFSRQQVLRSGPLDVNELVTHMTGMLTMLAGQDVRVVLALSPDIGAAIADRGQLEQVVMNLVVNARDAMPDGGTLRIETAEVVLENSRFHDGTSLRGQFVVITIADTGSGMTEETQRRLFEPFYTTKAGANGTGLGLSTVYGIVKQSHGNIWMHSELGRGTTFKVYVPRSSQGVVADSLARRVSAPVKRASETVLLVEDDAGVRKLAMRILDRAGYRVLEAGNGDDAERLFARHASTIDLVVTDMMMPGCSGPELLDRLLLRAPALKALCMSGYRDQSWGHSAGFPHGFGFVQKPFTAADFERQVRDALR